MGSKFSMSMSIVSASRALSGVSRKLNTLRAELTMAIRSKGKAGGGGYNIHHAQRNFAGRRQVKGGGGGYNSNHVQGMAVRVVRLSGVG
jgi:hypothetical protein